MHRKLRANGLLLITAFLPGAWSAPANAALGDSHESVEVDRQALHASVQQVQFRGYSVMEMQTDLGVQVRQYETPSGTVFAVTWQGPFKPDLRQLLGRHFERFSTTPRDASQPRRRAARITVPGGAVVQSFGHPRAFSGMAYLPSLLPAGVTVDDIR